MEVITIDSQAYKELVAKINAIAKFVIDHQDGDKMNPDEMWVDSYDVCTFLKISERTLQRLRSKRQISYSIISGKSYYETFARRLVCILLVNSLYNRELFCIFEH